MSKITKMGEMMINRVRLVLQEMVSIQMFIQELRRKIGSIQPMCLVVEIYKLLLKKVQLSFEKGLC